MDQDPENLVKRFVEDLRERQRKIAKKVDSLYPLPKSNDDRVSLSEKARNLRKTWVNQVPVFGFNSGRYNINMIKEYFVKNLAGISNVNVAKKENSYMFLSLPQFKFLDIKSYLAPGLSYAAWCRAYGTELQKLVFPYEWFDSFDKLNHKGPVKYEKTREQYYPDEIDLLKDAVSIPGISMTYVLNEAEKRKKYSEPALFAPGEPCKCKCSDDCVKVGCKDCREARKDCKIHTKNEAYETLTTGMVGGPSIVFCRYAEAGISKIRSQYKQRSKNLPGSSRF